MDEVERQRIEEAGQRADDAQRRADEMKFELDRWNAATETAQERIDRLIDKAADLESAQDERPFSRAD